MTRDQMKIALVLTLLALALVLWLRHLVVKEIKRQADPPKEEPPAFNATAWDDFPESDLLAIVHQDRPIDDFRRLINHRVMIDGRPYLCVEVETRHAKRSPVSPGAKIGLRVVPMG